MEFSTTKETDDVSPTRYKMHYHERVDTVEWVPRAGRPRCCVGPRADRETCCPAFSASNSASARPAGSVKQVAAASCSQSRRPRLRVGCHRATRQIQAVAGRHDPSSDVIAWHRMGRWAWNSLSDLARNQSVFSPVLPASASLVVFYGVSLLLGC